MKRIICMLMSITVLFICLVPSAFADLSMERDDEDVDAAVFEDSGETVTDSVKVKAPSAILIEKETGTVLFEKNADEKMQPASVTKVMTILLIVEAVESGRITLDDSVSVSEYAAGMGGSQIFLEPNETMTAGEMLKSIVVASANDAAVAMAEHIAGSESAFVELMNGRAGELGMENTNFMNCTGLLDQPEHLTTARDISLMSRELIKHDWIKDYTTIWMDTVRGGEFGLSNTNKLIRYYDGATGLKTGFTSTARYCLSATAEREGVEYIAVVLGCETSGDRFESAKDLLSYGFSNYTLVSALPDEVLPPIPVKMGESETVQPEPGAERTLLVKKSRAAGIEKELELSDELTAPVEEGEVIGNLRISSEGETLADIPIVAGYGVKRLTAMDVFTGLVKELLFGENK